jgi:hypothetical protein
MADYSAYLPQTPPSSAFLGLSPEEQAQLASYARPSASGRTHPMGGLALAGRERYKEGMGQYLDAVLQGNVWRQHQLQQVMRNNLQEAGINQMGRLGPELVRSGDTRLMAGSLFAGDQLPGLQDEQGAPSDAAIEADANARAIKEAQRQKDVATSANQMQQAGYTPEVQALARNYNLPMSKSSPTAVQVAALHAAGMRGSGGGAPVSDYTTQYYDKDHNSPTYGQLITRKHYVTREQATAGGGNFQPTVAGQPVVTQPGPTLTPSSPAVSSGTTTGGIPPNFTEIAEEQLNDDQSAAATSAAADAAQQGYNPVGVYTDQTDGSTVLIVQNAAGDQHAFNLDEGVSGAGGDEGP